MVCEEEITYKTGNPTRHKNKFHEKVLVNFQKRLAAKRSSNGVALSSGCACSTTGTSTELVVDITPEQQGHVDKLLAVWVAKSLRPFSIVEDAGLVELIRYLTEVLGKVRIQLPSRNKLRKDTELVAIRLRISVREIITRECRYFTVTTDIWTSRNTDSYLSLTLHYITPDFNFRSWTLEVISFPGRHSGPAIANGLAVLFDKWGLDRRLCVKLIRDGASNAVSAGTLLSLDHMSCVAHSLHLVLAGVLVKRKPKRVKTRSVAMSEGRWRLVQTAQKAIEQHM